MPTCSILAPPLHRTGGGAEESGDTAIEFVALGHTNKIAACTWNWFCHVIFMWQGENGWLYDCRTPRKCCRLQLTPLYFLGIKFSCLMVVLAHMIGVLSNYLFSHCLVWVICTAHNHLHLYTYLYMYHIQVSCIMCVHVHVPIVQVLQIMYKAMHSGLVSL